MRPRRDIQAAYRARAHRDSRRFRGRGGFTLLELTVALAIVSVMSLSLYASLRIAFGARKSAMSAVEPVAAAHAAIEMFVADLEASLPPTGILAGAMVGTDGTGDGGATSDMINFYSAAGTVRPDFSDVSGTTGLTTNSSLTASTQETKPARRAAADVMNVEYVLIADPDTGATSLVRRITRNLLSTVDPQVEEQVLCRHAAAFSVRFYDGSEWLDEWDSSQYDNQLPMAVEVALDVDRTAWSTAREARSLAAIGETQSAAATAAPGAGNLYRVSRIVMLPCSIGAGEQGTQVKR